MFDGLGHGVDERMLSAIRIRIATYIDATTPQGLLASVFSEPASFRN
jgi:RES domain-containing protein